MSYPSHDPKPAKAVAVSNVNIGLPLTFVLMAVYAGFIGLGTFAGGTGPADIRRRHCHPGHSPMGCS